MFTLRINLNNLVDNVRYLKSKTNAAFCAVVKANAYGHGISLVKYIDDYVDAYAVANGNEALKLRKYSAKPIYVICPSDDIGDKNVIYSAANQKDLFHKRVCVKINTGMNRLGILPSKAKDFLKECSARKVSVDSIYTHFSDVDYAPVQFKRFMDINTDLKRHACASNFLLLNKKYHLDMVRCGLALYGYGDENLKPILSAYTSVYNVLHVKKGDKIGYLLQADKDMKIAVLGVGYADSVKRQRQAFYIGGKVCYTVGDICMDMCLVDVSGINVKKGDIAQFLGDKIDCNQIANNNSTIIYDILTLFGSRCRRIYE